MIYCWRWLAKCVTAILILFQQSHFTFSTVSLLCVVRFAMCVYGYSSSSSFNMAWDYFFWPFIHKSRLAFSIYGQYFFVVVVCPSKNQWIFGSHLKLRLISSAQLNRGIVFIIITITIVIIITNRSKMNKKNDGRHVYWLQLAIPEYVYGVAFSLANYRFQLLI